MTAIAPSDFPFTRRANIDNRSIAMHHLGLLSRYKREEAQFCIRERNESQISSIYACELFAGDIFGKAPHNCSNQAAKTQKKKKRG